MEVDANVWAKEGENGIWFKASITKVEEIVDKKKKSVKFKLSKQDASGNPTGIIIELIVEGTLNEDFDCIKLQNVHDKPPELLEDLTTLTHLHEPAILYCLRERFEKGLIYTNTGPILIAVNPFKTLNIYENKYVEKYRLAGESARFNEDTMREPPHVYQVADRAYRNMVDIANRNSGEVPNQSILVSGESGAGKTVTTKFIMRYLADITRPREGGQVDGDGSIERQVLQSNPILESFGNARTLRNDNSSRFGKFIEIKFSPGKNIYYRIIGATIRTYLLEKVRLVRQGQGERNFHCFYELIKGGADVDRTRWGLTSLDDFYYTNQSGEQNRQDGVDDREQYKETRAAMDDMNFSSEEQNSVLDVVAALLHLGNVTFDVKVGVGEEEDGSSVSPSCVSHVECCCDLLGLSQDALEKVLCEKQIKTKEKLIIKRQTVADAEYARDALAKTIYGALFDWVARRVNAAISSDAKKQPMIPTFIGVLDIFGFESFRTNSFEQLCINYTNERLQQHFNEFVFNDEQKLYTREGISWNFIQFPDNSEILDLLENRRQGIFALCDEQVLFPKATDITLARKFYENCSAHPRFHAGSAEQARYHFIIRHFAGPVTYSSASFLEKNHDVVRADMARLMQSSRAWLVKQLNDFFRFEDGELGPPNATPKSRNTTTKKIFTLSGEFRKQLTELMENINTTSPHYIRCIKPNSRNVAGILEEGLVVDQLKCNGVLEAVRVSRAGFPNRFTFEQFGRLYHSLADPSKKGPWRRNEIDKLCEQLSRQALASPNFSPSPDSLGQSDIMLKAGIQRGTSMVFLRRGTFDFLERGRLLLQRNAAIKVQTNIRRYLHRSKFVQIRHAVVVLQCAIRSWRARSKVYLIRRNRGASKIQRIARGFLARLFISRTIPNFSKLSEVIIAKKEQKRKLEMKRIANASIIAKFWRRVTRKRIDDRRKKAADIILNLIRSHIRRRMTLRMYSEALTVLKAERHVLANQLADVTMQWSQEKEAILRASRARSSLSADEVQALRLELSRTQKELALAKSYIEKWKQRANSALTNGGRSSDPTCDEPTLRSMINKEVMGQLHDSAVELAKVKARSDSLEIQNQALLRLSETKAIIPPSVVSAEPSTPVSAENRRPFSTPQSKTPASATSSVEIDDFSTVSSIEYQKDLDDFDKTLSQTTRAQRAASYFTPSPGPISPLANSSAISTGLESRVAALKDIFQSSSGDSDKNDAETQRYMLSRIEELKSLVDNLTSQHSDMEDQIDRIRLERDNLKKSLQLSDLENDNLKSQMAPSGSATMGRPLSLNIPSKSFRGAAVPETPGSRRESDIQARVRMMVSDMLMKETGGSSVSETLEERNKTLTGRTNSEVNLFDSPNIPSRHPKEIDEAQEDDFQTLLMIAKTKKNKYKDVLPLLYILEELQTELRLVTDERDGIEQQYFKTIQERDEANRLLNVVSKEYDHLKSQGGGVNESDIQARVKLMVSDMLKDSNDAVPPKQKPNDVELQLAKKRLEEQLLQIKVEKEELSKNCQLLAYENETLRFQIQSNASQAQAQAVGSESRPAVSRDGAAPNVSIDLQKSLSLAMATISPKPERPLSNTPDFRNRVRFMVSEAIQGAGVTPSFSPELARETASANNVNHHSADSDDLFSSVRFELGQLWSAVFNDPNAVDKGNQNGSVLRPFSTAGSGSDREKDMLYNVIHIQFLAIIFCVITTLISIL